MFSILEPPSSTDLTTPVAVRRELKSDDSSLDERLAELIGQATAAIQSHCRRRFCRMKVRERFGLAVPDQKVRLTHNPVVGTPEITRVGQDGSVIATVTDFEVVDVDLGFLYRHVGWGTTPRVGRADSGLSDVVLDTLLGYTSDYYGGYLLPGDAYTSQSISFEASDNSINDAAAALPMLAPGELVRIEIPSGSANAGLARVESRTPSKLVVSGKVFATEDLSNEEVRLVCANLDAAVERAAVLTVADWFRRKPRDRSVASKTVGPLSITYRADDDTLAADLSSDAVKLLKCHRRVFG